MSYDIDKIKAKIAKLQSKGKPKRKSFDDEEKLTYFKPALGTQEIRFLPYTFSTDGSPFQQVDYYNNKELLQGRRRIVAPVQWGLPDPIAELAEELSARRSDDSTWRILKNLKVTESYYAPILVRGQEKKRVQIWEMKPTVATKIFAILAHPDYATENMFDAKNGYDFVVTCTDSGKTVSFGKETYAVKDFDVQPRRRPSPIFEDQEDIDRILEEIPNLNEFHKKFCMKEEKLKEVVLNYLNSGETEEESQMAEEKEELEASSVDSEAAKRLDDAFADLDLD